MAITQAMCSSFKQDCLSNQADFSADTTYTYKVALYTSAATLNASTTAYTPTNEVSGTGYTAGGNTLTITGNPTISGTTAFVDFGDSQWTNSTITARGALIYNDTLPGKNAVAVYDFGSDRSSTNATFTVTFPAADAANAIVRIE